MRHGPARAPEPAPSDRLRRLAHRVERLGTVTASPGTPPEDHCDACFTGDYAIPLIDAMGNAADRQLSLLQVTQ